MDGRVGTFVMILLGEERLWSTIIAWVIACEYLINADRAMNRKL